MEPVLESKNQPQTPGPKINMWSELLNVFVNPIQAIQNIAERGKVLPLMGGIIALNLIILAAAWSKMKELIIWSLKNAPQTSQLDQGAFNQLVQMYSYISIIGVIVSPLLTWLVIATLLKIYDLFAVRGTSFKKLFLVTIAGYLPILVGGILGTGLIFIVPIEKAITTTSFSLGFLASDPKSFLGIFLSQCSPFSWWSLALMGIGGGKVMGSSSKGVTAYLFAIWVVFALGMTAWSKMMAVVQ